jgi:hypothetical protein
MSIVVSGSIIFAIIVRNEWEIAFIAFVTFIGFLLISLFLSNKLKDN